MGATTERSSDGGLDHSDAGPDLGVAPRRRSSTGTEADKVRRQQQLRRKARLARHALAASRTR
jgi:hypothetical protein